MLRKISIIETFALIHSPLVGPSTWKKVAAYLQQKEYSVIVPTLTEPETDRKPYWKQHAESATKAINDLSSNKRCILVGHSGAGPILPAIGERLELPPFGYIFVDAGLPDNQKSRLDMMKSETGEWVLDFEKHLSNGGKFPNWSESDLLKIIPDDDSRQLVLQEINMRDLSFFTEKISFCDDWSTAPCGYMQFSENYDISASRARCQGWSFIKLESGHFHMLVEPVIVGDKLIELGEQLIHG